MSSLSMLIAIYASSTISMTIINLRFLSLLSSPSFESGFLWMGGYFVTLPQKNIGILDNGRKSFHYLIGVLCVFRVSF